MLWCVETTQFVSRVGKKDTLLLRFSFVSEVMFLGNLR